MAGDLLLSTRSNK